MFNDWKTKIPCELIKFGIKAKYVSFKDFIRVDENGYNITIVELIENYRITFFHQGRYLTDVYVGKNNKAEEIVVKEILRFLYDT